MSDNYVRCRWCNRSYPLGTGEYKNLCSRKCNNEFYTKYPNQFVRDLKDDEEAEKKRKRENERFWFWIIVFGILAYFYFS